MAGKHKDQLKTAKTKDGHIPRHGGPQTGNGYSGNKDRKVSAKDIETKQK